MPYFVYHLSSDKSVPPELQETYDQYRPAKEHVRELRKQNPDQDINNFRMIFADDTQKARILLTTQREKPQVEEWEN